MSQNVDKNPKSKKVHAVWLQGAGCSGCTISLIQTDNPDLRDLAEWFKLSIDFHPTIMISAGEAALKILHEIKSDGNLDVLIIEGAIPTNYYCAFGEEGDKPIS